MHQSYDSNRCRSKSRTTYSWVSFILPSQEQLPRVWWKTILVTCVLLSSSRSGSYSSLDQYHFLWWLMDRRLEFRSWTANRDWLKLSLKYTTISALWWSWKQNLCRLKHYFLTKILFHNEKEEERTVIMDSWISKREQSWCTRKRVRWRWNSLNQTRK